MGFEADFSQNVRGVDGVRKGGANIFVPPRATGADLWKALIGAGLSGALGLVTHIRGCDPIANGSVLIATKDMWHEPQCQ